MEGGRGSGREVAMEERVGGVGGGGGEGGGGGDSGG